MLKHLTLLVFLLLPSLATEAQIGEHRNGFAIGVNGGYAMSNVGFTPKVNQGMLGGFTGGLTMRYVSEKYFNTICSLQAEVNYVVSGWKQEIETLDGGEVINPTTGRAETYSREISYVEVPIFAHLAWGKEQKGLNFFFQAGPQMGIYLSDKVKASYPVGAENFQDRVSPVAAQESMPIEKKFDYGIAAGLGMEYSHPKVGHIQVEGRYYYGLANIYGNTKRDYFSKSNLGRIVVKVAYLFDLSKKTQSKTKE